MFGLAGRTGYVRIETRARNAVTMLWPDAAQTRARKGSIADGADAQRFGPHTAKLLRAAEGTGLDARASRDAGSYLCNYLSWRAIEAVNAEAAPASPPSFTIPPLARGGAVRRKGFPRITLEELVDAGEAMLLEMVRLARRANCSLSSLRTQDLPTVACGRSRCMVRAAAYGPGSRFADRTTSRNRRTQH